MPLADLSSLAGDDAVRVAGDAGAITVADDEVRAAHPLYVGRGTGAAVAGGADARGEARFSSGWPRRRPRDVVDRLRLAVLALDSDNAAAGRRRGGRRRPMRCGSAISH